MLEIFTEIPLGVLAGYAGLGLIAGVLAGLLGVGGGLVMVPVLIVLFRLQGMSEAVIMHVAIGTSLAVIIATAVSSIRAHHKRGAVLWPQVARLTPGLVLGSLFGAGIADSLDTAWLQRVFGVFAILVSVQMFMGARFEARRELPATPGMIGVGSLIGTVSGLVGIGGGSMTVPFLSWCGVSIRMAVATSAACGLPIAVAGTVGFIGFGQGSDLPLGGTGYVYWPAALAVALLSMLTAPLGAFLAHSLPVQHLRRGFALLLFLVGLRLLFGV
jgi:uncharacterized membrane protein YfcA